MTLQERIALPAVDAANPLLAPIIARWQAEPGRLFAVVHAKDTWVSVSLDAVMQRALRFSKLYGSTGHASGRLVMLVLRSGLDSYAAFIGAMLAGFVPSFLPYPNSRQDEPLYWRQHRAVLNFCKPAIVLVFDDLLPAMSECASECGAITMAQSAVETCDPAGIPALLPHADAICLLQHSSGTTGLKKGVALSYRSVTLQLERYCEAIDIGRTDDRIASWLPLYHDMGLLSSFLLPAWLGVAIVSIDPFVWVAAPSLLFDAIQDHGATHAWLPNFAFLHMAKRVSAGRQWALGTVRALVDCSEPCKPAALDTFLERFASMGIRLDMLQTSYAMAETVFAVSQTKPGRPVRRLAIDQDCVTRAGPVNEPVAGAPVLTLLSNGPPIRDCVVQILQNGEFVGQRQIGEICVAAPFVMSRYFNDTSLTSSSYHGDLYRSGDLGFLDGGEVFVVGRLKDVIIVSGKNIFAHDVEEAVSRVPGVKAGRCVAFGHYSKATGSERLVVVAERSDPVANDAETVRLINHSVAEAVGVACSDIRMVDVGWLVKTSSGKTSRSENARRYEAMRCV